MTWTRATASEGALTERDLISMFLGLPEAVIVVDGEGAVRWANHAAERLFGWSLAEWIGRNAHEVVHPDDAALLTAVMDGGPYDTGGAPVELRLQTESDWLTVELVGRPLPEVGDAIVLCVRDLTTRRRDDRGTNDRAAVDTELRNALSLLSATLDSTADGLLVVDNAGQITSFNRSFAEMWRLPTSILETRDDHLALHSVLDQLVDPDAFLGKVNELYADLEAESEDTLEFKDGRFFERTSKPQRVDGHVVGRVWSFSDVTDRKRLEAELAHQAFHDALTGLANKALFRDRVEHALARCARTGARVAVLFLDLDNFKTVNDSLGHNRGDQLLAAVSERLRKCLRAADTAARLGGDEFAVLLEDVGELSAAETAANRLLGTIGRPFRLADMDLTISASLGIAFDAPGADVDQLLRNADLAMYRAKTEGRARHAVYEPEMHIAAVERLEIEADLRRASRNGELVVYYQPIVELHSGVTVGAEALVRWQHPTRGLLPPTAFIRLAEETGHIDDIGRFVMSDACGALRDWQAAASTAAAPLTVTVNLSAHELVRPWIVRDVSDAIDASGVAPEDVVIEITESALMADGPAVVGNLHGLKNLGVRLAIDDFGTGYSSLAYLRRFPIDILKIDGSFIRAIEDGPEAASLARAIVKLAHNLELVAIAEHVETRGQADFLRNLGCHHAQGYYFGAPQAKTAFSRLLTA